MKILCRLDDGQKQKNKESSNYKGKIILYKMEILLFSNLMYSMDDGIVLVC